MNDDKDMNVDGGLKRAYAELSTEVTPRELDAKILAAAEPSKRLSNLLALKPLSWAAITVLSIGLVLELQRSTPEPDAAMPEADMAPPMLQADQIEATAADMPAASRDAAQGLAAETPIAEPVNRSLKQVREAAAETETLDLAPAERSAQLYEDLDDLASAPEPERFCEEAETVDAGSWYRCVLGLRDEGLTEQADFELSLLKTRFPDFEVR